MRIEIIEDNNDKRKFIEAIDGANKNCMLAYFA